MSEPLPPLEDPPHIQTRARLALTAAVIFAALWHYIIRPGPASPMLDVLLGLVFGYWFRRADR